MILHVYIGSANSSNTWQDLVFCGQLIHHPVYEGSSTLLRNIGKRLQDYTVQRLHICRRENKISPN
jgi:hypothetical protein